MIFMREPQSFAFLLAGRAAHIHTQRPARRSPGGQDSSMLLRAYCNRADEYEWPGAEIQTLGCCKRVIGFAQGRKTRGQWQHTQRLWHFQHTDLSTGTPGLHSAPSHHQNKPRAGGCLSSRWHLLKPDKHLYNAVKLGADRLDQARWSIPPGCSRIHTAQDDHRKNLSLYTKRSRFPVGGSFLFRLERD